VNLVTDKACAANILNTTINGITRKGSTFFDTQYSMGKLRITQLLLAGQSNIQVRNRAWWKCDRELTLRYRSVQPL
jgi:hypothetical protein